MKRKSKFTNHSFRENDKKRNRLICDNFGEDEKEQLKKIGNKKKEDNKRKKERRDNLDDSEKKKQLRKYEKEVKQVMRDNLDVQ